ncbi:MAG TPA: ribonuclease D [Gammaproteobacteria bacterium]|nr:ribonuclease D [Gammaproteobacteria bacterium]
MSPELITEESALADLCRDLRNADWLAVDTEFLRERTYRARLCLVQVATPGLVACIDPLALGSLAPLMVLLQAPTVRKVLHAARQDLEVFYDLEARVPAPLFDTQIAAAYLGHDDQIGYGALVQTVTGHTLEKTQTRTDWSRRPLSTAQLEYAADDVRYLRPVYAQLTEQLAASGRQAWVDDDCARLTDAARYDTNPDHAWQRLRGGADLPPPQQQVLRALAVWRERTAQERDRPRSWIVRDEVLFELARRLPATLQALHGISGLDERTVSRHGAALLDAIDEGRHAEAVVVWERTPPLDRQQNEHVRQLMAHVRELAQQQRLAPAVLATRRDIEKLVRGADPTQLFTGWRAELLTPLLEAARPAAGLGRT